MRNKRHSGNLRALGAAAIAEQADGAEGSVTRLFASAPVQLLCRLALGALFLYAALPKVADPAAFAKDLANYRMLPESLVHVSAVVLPWIEVLVAALLVVGIATRAAALLCTALLLVFTVAIGAAVSGARIGRGASVESGSSGSGSSGIFY